MGRSTTCFKIITCGSDSVDQDDLQASSESKGSSDKRGWSFRKRSARHRVLSNTVITETPSSGNKESPESAAHNFHTTADTSVPEKFVLPWPDEKPQLSISVESNVTETIVAKESENKVDVRVEESVVISIQAAVRGFLAQRALLKLKNVVKLQAAVRGHLVRRHAVGTLRCVQAIVKMQALVRARHTRLSLERSCTEERVDRQNEKDIHSSKSTEKKVSATKPTVMYTSIEKLLSNRFARQLLVSTPKTKPIHIKCDPSGPNSSWKWLERWMSVSSPDLGESQRPELSKKEKDLEKVEKSSPQMETKISSEVCESADFRSSIRETEVPVESEDILIPYEVNNFDFQAGRPRSTESKDNLEQPQPEKIDKSNAIENPVDNFDFQAGRPRSIESKDNLEQPQPEKNDKSNAIENPVENNLIPNQMIELDAESETNFNSLSGKPEVETEQPIRSMKRFASEQLEFEGRKSVSGSRKASNPAFIAAHSKFEELSSTPSSGRANSSSEQNIGVDSNIHKISSGANAVINTKELDLAENPVPHYSKIPVGGSDCGTELSITSTLDSPDRSDTEAMEFDHEAKVSKEEGIRILGEDKNLDVEAKDMPIISVSNFTDSASVKPEKVDAVNGKSVSPVAAVDLEQAEQKRIHSMHMEREAEMGHQAYRSSPEASPRSHITVPESQGTPSSLVSAKSKQVKSDRSGSNHKRKSWSAGKRSPSNALYDSGARDSVEQLSKDQKAGKRRNSFGSVDHVDQEQRDSSSSSNSIPSYMQATESARAKAHANNSPRSSPDVQVKDIYIKKRHSLPGANGRHGSPRVQRAMSQAQPGAKGNTHPHERKWQR